jgi:hypothetical protein
VKFRIDRSKTEIPNSVLVYRPEDYSFDVEPAPSRAFTSILIADLSLEIDSAGRMISVWGTCPHTGWRESTLAPPEAQFGNTFVIPDSPLTRGVSVRLTDDLQMPVFVDKASGWVCIRGKRTSTAAVKPLANVILEIDDEGYFSALWLRPLQLPTGI